MSESLKFRGIYPILYAFFDRQGKLDREAMGLQIRACLEAGAHGLAMHGLATEVAKLEESERLQICLLYTSPSPRDRQKSRMPSSA